MKVGPKEWCRLKRKTTAEHFSSNMHFRWEKATRQLFTPPGSFADPSIRLGEQRQYSDARPGSGNIPIIDGRDSHRCIEVGKG